MARKWTPASQDPAEFDRQFEAARAAGRAAEDVEPRAESAAFDAAARRVSVQLRSGVLFAFPVALYPELASQPDEVLQAMQVTASGHGLHWDAADVHLSVPQVVAELFGRHVARYTGAEGGKRRSDAKTAAARRNAVLGGRPARQSEAEPGPDLLRVDAYFGKLHRLVEIRIGGEYVVEPMNPAARRNRGRTGSVVAFGDVKDDRVQFRFHDTGRIALIEPSDLLPLPDERTAAD